MNAPRRDGGERVRFVVPPSDEVSGSEIRGVRLPPFGVFMDPGANVIPIVLDETDAFCRMTAGLFFTQAAARRALNGSLLRSMTSESEWKELFREITESGLARRMRTPLKRALVDFNRPTWGICRPTPHFHVYLRGQMLWPRKCPARVVVQSVVGASLTVLALQLEKLIRFSDADRLLLDLRNDPRFEKLPQRDPPLLPEILMTILGAGDFADD